MSFLEITQPAAQSEAKSRLPISPIGREAVKPSEACTPAELESGTFSFMVQHTGPTGMHIILGGQFKTPLAGVSRHQALPVYFFKKNPNNNKPKNQPLVFPRAPQELLQSSPGEHPSDATCLIPRWLCSNQEPHGKLSSASLTRTAFHDSLFPSTSPTGTAAQWWGSWAGSDNQDRPTATTAAKESPEN